MNQLCSTFGVPRTFSSTGLVLLRAVVLQCSVNALRSAAERRMKDKQKERGPRTSPASFVFICEEIMKKTHLIFPDQTKRKAEQLHLFASAALTDTVLAELVLSS